MGDEKHIIESDFLDLLPEMVFEIDKDLKLKILNRSCELLLGYTKEEMINKRISLKEIVLLEDIERLQKSLKENFNGNHTSGNNYRVYKKNKEIVTLEVYNSHIKKNGKTVGLRCIAIDVTEKERKREELTSKEKHYRQIFQNFPIPYQSLDANGNIIDINPAWIDLLGYSKNEIIGKSIKIILSKKDKVRFEKLYNKFKNRGIVSDINFDFITNSGEIIYVSLNGKIEYSENNEFMRTHCVFSDITLQRKAEQTLIKSENRLRELNATKDKFFSIIAHDLKNPFNDLMGFTQLLALNIDKYDKSKIEQFSHIIHQSSKLAYNLLENLLDWSRSQTGTLKFKPEKIPIDTLIHESVSLLESTARNKNIRIFSEIDKHVFAYADKNMIRTVLRNLISNAIKYTHQGGHIKIKTSCRKNCEVSIIDNGIGISRTNIEKIFKLDESYSTNGTEKEKGTGLGLLLCKEFVEKNGGKLWVKSELDKGSTFTFSLPTPDFEFV